MLSWLGTKLVTYNMKRLNAGDPEPTLRMEHEDVTLHFPGDSTWSGVWRASARSGRGSSGSPASGCRSSRTRSIVKGWPWNQTICVRGHDSLSDPSGERVYENRYVIWGRLEWGRMRSTRSTRTPRRPRRSTTGWRCTSRRRCR